MRKIIIALLIIILIAGTAINAKTDQQFQDGVPLPEAYFQCSDCVQTILWIMFSIISGFTLLFDPEPLAKWLEKSKNGSKGSIFTLRLLGIFLLAMILLTEYQIKTNCQTFCGLFSK
jgi:hypothetical protein